MTGRRRRELADSFRLFASDEQWFPRDLFVGVVALVVWVAGTGALATQVAGAIDVPLGFIGGETLSPVAIAIFGVLWLVVPAVAVVVRLRRRMLNLRGNVEQYYRLDHPAALLVPPATLLVAVSVVAVALGAFSWTFSLVMIPVGLYALVRTLAFSYRVYSFSHPSLVQAFVGLSTVVLLASSFAAIGMATGRETLVDQVLRTAGLPAWITGTVTVEGVVVSGLATAALFPVVMATAYVLVQTVVAIGVRLVKPDVDRSEMRTGQRYPRFLPSATPLQTPAQPDDAGGKAADVDDAAAADAGASATDGDATGATAADGTDEPDEEEEDLDDVSNTRVFTPPADDGPGEFDASVGDDAGPTADSESTAGTAGETRAVPDADGAADASTTDGREHCSSCGESFTVDTAVRFCPNCGAALEGE